MSAPCSTPLETLNQGGQLAISEEVPYWVMMATQDKIIIQVILYLPKIIGHLKPYPSIYFCPENVVCFICLLHIFKCTSDFNMEANTMNPDQTAPHGSSLIWVHIVYTTKVLIDRKKLTLYHIFLKI